MRYSSIRKPNSGRKSSCTVHEEAKDLLAGARTSKFELKKPLMNQDTVYQKSSTAHKVSFFFMIKEIKKYTSGANRVFLNKIIDRFQDKKDFK